MFESDHSYSIEDIEKGAMGGIVSTVAGDTGVFACCYAEYKNPWDTVGKTLLWVFCGDDGNWWLMGTYDKAWTRQIASALIDLAHADAAQTAQEGNHKGDANMIKIEAKWCAAPVDPTFDEGCWYRNDHLQALLFKSEHCDVVLIVSEGRIHPIVLPSNLVKLYGWREGGQWVKTSSPEITVKLP